MGTLCERVVYIEKSMTKVVAYNKKKQQGQDNATFNENSATFDEYLTDAINEVAVDEVAGDIVDEVAVYEVVVDEIAGDAIDEVTKEKKEEEK
ncbi:hypothetical protein H5410_027261 [Solanum commersonii]|uniref:Uncharacterized protein n=1 Tax=Solanum commersonii TaxID=4109 RepID=A0A9J5YYR5_SOLCO|nr:hypothetical protein H5410_027261 [Solanum commersonii]